jgi:hypothetical protein
VPWTQRVGQDIAGRINAAPGGAGALGQAITSTIPTVNPWAPQINVGGAPDYSALIGGDYEVQAAESQMASRMQRAQGDFRSQIRQAFIDLGATDTTTMGSLGKYIDAATIKSAAANKYSQYAQIQQAEAQANAQNQASLAARGILTSGQTAKSAEDVLTEAERGRYQGNRSFMSAGQQGLTSLADLQDQLASNVAMARAAAAQRAAELYYWNQGNQQQQPNNPYGNYDAQGNYIPLSGAGPHGGAPGPEMAWDPIWNMAYPKGTTPPSQQGR